MKDEPLKVDGAKMISMNMQTLLGILSVTVATAALYFTFQTRLSAVEANVAFHTQQLEVINKKLDDQKEVLNELRYDIRDLKRNKN